MSDILPVGQRCSTDRSIERHNGYPYCDGTISERAPEEPSRDGSIIVVVATDAPLLPHQLRRLAKRPSLGLGRLGATREDGSGDIFIAFSTANPGLISEKEKSQITMYPNNKLSIAFSATIQATEEAVVNAMVAAETVIGINGFRVSELPEDQVRKISTGTE